MLFNEKGTWQCKRARVGWSVSKCLTLAVLLCNIGWKINSKLKINYRSQKLQILVKVRINSRDIISFAQEFEHVKINSTPLESISASLKVNQTYTQPSFRNTT